MQSSGEHAYVSAGGPISRSQLTWGGLHTKPGGHPHMKSGAKHPVGYENKGFNVLVEHGVKVY